MDVNNPKISVIIITKNRASFIAKAIESVLNQTFTDWELIILDNDSNDGTEGIVACYKAKDNRIKYQKNPKDQGISKSRNVAISLSRGKYIAMLDSDDYWIDKNKLQKQFDFLEKNPDFGMIGSAIVCVDKNGEKIRDYFYETEDKKIRRRILIRNQFTQSSVMFRKSVLDEIEGYSETLNVAEDFDLWLEIGRRYKFANLKDQTTAYTIHTGGVSKERKIEMAKTVNKIIERNKNNYPNYFIAKLSSIYRIIKAFI